MLLQVCRKAALKKRAQLVESFAVLVASPLLVLGFPV